MKNLEKLQISREESLIFFQTRCIPAHPFVIEDFNKKKTLEYSLMNKAVDVGLEWTYKDIQENPNLISTEDIGWNLQTNQGKYTKDVEVIKDWLNKKEHSYYEFEDGQYYKGKDQEKFPFKGFRLHYSGVYIGQKPVIIISDYGWIYKQDIKFYNKDTLLPKETMDFWEIIDNKNAYKIPHMWYTKDANDLIRLFGKNFAINYNNLVIEEKIKK